ncbi:MAG: cyclic nucleotide-binding/CBS domain-containing protein [Nitrospirota bacterium]
MTTRTGTELSRRASLDAQIDRLRAQLGRLDPLLSPLTNASVLVDFDAATEQVIAEAFGSTSDNLETYYYAQLGEAASMLNLQEDAPEGSHDDVGRESLRQRRRVLESCIWELEAKRASNARKRTPTPQVAARVSEYMTRSIQRIGATATLRNAGAHMDGNKIGCLFVEEQGRYVGTLTEAMLSRAVVAQGLDPATTPVKRCMDETIVSIDNQAPLVEAVKLMKDRGVRHLAVTEDGAIVGVLSVSDLLRYYSGV